MGLFVNLDSLFTAQNDSYHGVVCQKSEPHTTETILSRRNVFLSTYRLFKDFLPRNVAVSDSKEREMPFQRKTMSSWRHVRIGTQYGILPRIAELGEPSQMLIRFTKSQSAR